MRIFACPHCRNSLYFENSLCTACGTAVAFDPASRTMTFAGTSMGNAHVCANREACGCNWIATEPDQSYCLSCRLTRTIPPVDDPVQRRRWSVAESAKRYLVHDLLRHGLAPLPLVSREGPLTFEILVSAEHGGEGAVTMGHADGVVTIDASEADLPMREQRREMLGEPYRTMLGHMRHETGHYMWDRLAALPGFSDAFRGKFGDERGDYGEALKRHYAEGPPENWGDAFISTYATAHPWEDWAEIFAHYLHMMDGLETARGAPDQLALRAEDSKDIEAAINDWIEISLFMNLMNRSLGHEDSYPFVLNPPVREKLVFVHLWLQRLAAAWISRPAD